MGRAAEEPEMTEPSIIDGVSISGFLLRPELDTLHFVGWTTTHTDPTTSERRIVLRFEMGMGEARRLKAALSRVLPDVH
jgi:hypothetical protein